MGIFTENFMKMVNINNSSNLSVVEEAQRYPENVRIYNGKDGKVYIPTVDLEQYMQTARITDLKEAMENISAVNPFVSISNMIITNNGCSETFLEHLVEESNKIGGRYF